MLQGQICIITVELNMSEQPELSGSDDSEKRRDTKHKKAMEKQKANVDASVAAADEERGVAILLTGNGKGKSSSAFGMVMRALGYGYKVGVVQFIKGEMLSGEEIYLKERYLQEQNPNVVFYQMGTGFTWNTQDRSGDIAAAKKTWEVSKALLADESVYLVVLDELTYMLAYDYLDEDEVIAALNNRPKKQSVVVTGRGGGSKLQTIMDTVSEVKEIKHAFNDGIKARKGVDF
jgi:cob(I)alamin adenosyltransferase